jgi:hypothetical protein
MSAATTSLRASEPAVADGSANGLAETAGLASASNAPVTLVEYKKQQAVLRDLIAKQQEIAAQLVS